MSVHRCEVCYQSDEDVRIVAVGGVMPSNIPLHAHTLHADCASSYQRGSCESCCSVIVWPTGKTRGRKGGGKP